MQARLKFAVGAAVIVATVVWLGWLGASQSKTYYHTIPELQGLGTKAQHERLRVSGTVVNGSIRRLPGRVDFVLEEQGQRLPVSYVGRDPLPDTFTDGAQALVEGRLMPDGRFVAVQVQAKCASKYEAMPETAPARSAPTGRAGQAPP
jgi:cytochrome c-type biogenesis protein CcmE